MIRDRLKRLVGRLAGGAPAAKPAPAPAPPPPTPAAPAAPEKAAKKGEDTPWYLEGGQEAYGWEHTNADGKEE